MDPRDKPESYGVTLEDFIKWRSPRFGKTNPEKITSNVWEWLFYSELTGYWSTKYLQGPCPKEAGPTLSFERYGQSITHLPDGRIIYIAGEHEDYYHPDFYIYNDVIVEHPDGQLEFYCYPEIDFIATDFHTATLIGKYILIIGSAGYDKQMVFNYTPVYLLDIESFEIKKINCTGEAPGWIHNHNVVFDNSQNVIWLDGGLIHLDDKNRKENLDKWKLDIKNWVWHRVTDKRWPNWQLRKENYDLNYLYEIRRALWYQQHDFKEYNEKIDFLEEKFGFKVDISLVQELYTFDFEHEEFQEDEEDSEKYWISIDGVPVSFVEDYFFVQVIVEGEISPKKLGLMREQLLAKLSQLTRSRWILTEY